MGMAGCFGGTIALGGCAVVLLAGLIGGGVALVLFAAVNPIITSTIVILIALGGFRAWQLKRRHQRETAEAEPPADSRD